MAGLAVWFGGIRPACAHHAPDRQGAQGGKG